MAFIHGKPKGTEDTFFMAVDLVHIGISARRMNTIHCYYVRKAVMTMRRGLFSLQPKVSLRVHQTKSHTEKDRKQTRSFYFLTLTLPRGTSISSWWRWWQKHEEGRYRRAMMHVQGPCRAMQWELQPPTEALSHRAGQPCNCVMVFSSDNLEQAIPNVHLTTSRNKTGLLTRKTSITFPSPLVLKSTSLPAVLWASRARPHQMLPIAAFWIGASEIKPLKTFSVSQIQCRWM